MRQQQGFALIELLISAAVVLLISVWSAQTLMNRINDAGAQQSANWMLMIRGAVYAYLDQYGGRLRVANNTAELLTQGYQNWASPQLSELKADGLLAAGFPERIRPLDGVRVHVLREGSCPGEECQVGAVIHSERAFLKAVGVVDEQMLAQWLLATKGLGGIVHPLQPDMIRGHTFQHMNPPSGGPLLPIGTVAMAISHDQLRESSYLRVRDTRDPQFQSDLTVQGNMAAGGDVSVGHYLRLVGSAKWLESCTAEGAVARDNMHGLLLCAGGVWQSGNRSSGGFSTNSRFECFTPDGRSSANPITESCTCPWGYAAVPISEGGDIESPRGLTRGYLCVRK